MLAAAFMFVLMPVLILGAFIVGAWREGRNSPYAFGIGRVISNSFGAIGGAPLALFAGSFVLNAPTTLSPPLFAGSGGEQWMAIGAIGILWLLLWPFPAIFMTALALDALAGRPADPRGAIAVAGRRYLSGLALFVLASIGLLAGFAMLIIPGLVLLLTWFAVWPVLAGEGRGVFDCFARSGELLNGMRWRLLLLLVIVFVLYVMFAGTGQALGLALGGEGGSWTNAIVGTVTGTLTGVLQMTGAAAVYHEARTAKEGMGSHDLEAVFA